MKLFEIINPADENVKVAAVDMKDALSKYLNHLINRINADYSYTSIFEQITECKYIGEYVEENIIK
jgi:uncharacterized protein (UPF0333 family)